MHNKFYIKRGDTKPDLVMLLQRSDGTYPELTNAKVMFKMAPKNGRGLKVDRDLETDNVNHLVRHKWQVTDTDQAGQYIAEVEVVSLLDNSKETFPSEGYITIEVTTDL